MSIFHCDHHLFKKYTQLLPESLKLWCFFQSKSKPLRIIFYLSPLLLKLENIAEQSAAYIELVVTEEDTSTISWLNVTDIWRGRGLAILLLTLTAEFLYRVASVTTIELDDMSDQAWKKDNIYTKLGFRYLNEFPEPEMEGNAHFIFQTGSKLLFRETDPSQQ